MYDPETTFQPIMDEIADSIATMRKLKQIDDKLKYSEHIQKLSATFENIVSTMTMMMNEELLEDEDLGEFDEEF